MSVVTQSKEERAANEVHWVKSSTQKLITDMCRKNCPEISIREIDALAEKIHANYAAAAKTCIDIYKDKESVRYVHDK